MKISQNLKKNAYSIIDYIQIIFSLIFTYVLPQELKPCTFLPLELEDLNEFLSDLRPISPQTEAEIERIEGDIDEDLLRRLIL